MKEGFNMLDLYELERLFNNWLKPRTQYSCEITPKFKTYAGVKVITLEIYRVCENGRKELIKTISGGNINQEKAWDIIFDKLFEYFMEIGKYVE